MNQAALNTMQRNALSQFFGRKTFTAEEVAELDYNIVAHLPKVGHKGITIIRAWLQQHGHDLSNLPVDDQPHDSRRLEQRLLQAAKLLQKHGYRVELQSLQTSNARHQASSDNQLSAVMMGHAKRAFNVSKS
jgi:hypothetical protein